MRGAQTLGHYEGEAGVRRHTPRVRRLLQYGPRRSHRDLGTRRGEAEEGTRIIAPEWP